MVLWEKEVWEMGIKWWHIAVFIAIYICCGRDLAIILILIYGINLLAKLAKKSTRGTHEDAQTEADMQDLDNEMYEVETMLDQMQEVGQINDELDEIEAVLDQLGGTEQADRKVIPIWDLPKKP